MASPKTAKSCPFSATGIGPNHAKDQASIGLVFFARPAFSRRIKATAACASVAGACDYVHVWSSPLADGPRAVWVDSGLRAGPSCHGAPLPVAVVLVLQASPISSAYPLMSDDGAVGAKNMCTRRGGAAKGTWRGYRLINRGCAPMPRRLDDPLSLRAKAYHQTAFSSKKVVRSRLKKQWRISSLPVQVENCPIS